jgi:Na+-driven multidrug efflux pump
MAVINALREIISMPIFGVERGASPVISFNYGAKLYDRVRQAIRFKVKVAAIYGVFATIVVMVIPAVLLGIFSSDVELIAAGVPALRIYYMMYAFMIMQMTAQQVFVGLGYTKQAIFFSLLRKAFLVAPLTILLPELGLGTYGVFIAEAISQLIGGLATFGTMYVIVYRRLKDRKDSINGKI